jgi:hypothetical protein
MERAQGYMTRARCLFEYANSEEACSPYAAMIAALRLRKMETSDFRDVGWNLTSKDYNGAL